MFCSVNPETPPLAHCMHGTDKSLATDSFLLKTSAAPSRAVALRLSKVPSIRFSARARPAKARVKGTSALSGAFDRVVISETFFTSLFFYRAWTITMLPEAHAERDRSLPQTPGRRRAERVRNALGTRLYQTDRRTRLAPRSFFRPLRQVP